MKSKAIGILGGMGPEATLELFRRIIENTPRGTDQDHHRVLIDSNPKIPDRTAAILKQGPDPWECLLESALTLEKAGASFLIMPCNTAHHWLGRLRQRLSIPFLDMIEATAMRVAEYRPKLTKVALLATTGTLETGLYAGHLGDRGIRELAPSESDREKIMKAIYKVKASDKSGRDSLLRICAKMAGAGAQGFILGCTELPLLIGEGDLDLPLFDPLTIIAREAVARISEL